MLIHIQKRATSWAGEIPDPTYPPGRGNATVINGRIALFMRSGAGRRRGIANVNLDGPLNGLQGGIKPPAETDQVRQRSWYLVSRADGDLVFTADYVTPPANLRVPTPQENPDGNFRRVYDQDIVSVLLVVRNNVIIDRLQTGVARYLVGTRFTIPGPNDTYVRQSTSGHKVLTGLIENDTEKWGVGVAFGNVDGGVSNYPAVSVTASSDAFQFSITFAGTTFGSPESPGDATIVSQTQRMIIEGGGIRIHTLGRPLTEEELQVLSEENF